MRKKRTPKHIKNLLPKVLEDIDKNYQKNPKNIKKMWPEVIGEKLAPMTKIHSFDKGVLVIKVKSSTLHSLLSNYEKERLLKKMQKKFSKKIIRNIFFKIG
jgi:hypothetical protein